MKERRKSTFANNCIHFIFLSFICINTQAQTATNTSLFPLLNPTNDKSIIVNDFTPENQKKLALF